MRFAGLVAVALVATAVGACGVSPGVPVKAPPTTTTVVQTVTHTRSTTTTETLPATITVPGASKGQYALTINGSAINGPYIGAYLAGVPGISSELNPDAPNATAQTIAGYLLLAGAKIDENQATCVPDDRHRALNYRCVVGNSTDSSDVTATLVQAGG